MVNDHSATLDAAFAALSDPTRRAILVRLARQGATVSELAAPFEMSLPAVSRHLRVLERAGLLERRIDGRVHRIGIVPGPLRTVEQWLAEHRDFWERRLDALARYLEGNEHEQEATPWQRPKSARTPRSGSNARSRPRARRSSPHGRRPKR
ncbi:MAG: ArsR/SmtB family transcription factor [Gemmatimonadales bacterium]